MRISDWSSDVCSSDLSFAAATEYPEADVGLGQLVRQFLWRLPVTPPCQPWMRMQPTSSFLGLLTVANNQKFQLLVLAQGINGLRDQGRALPRHESADEQHFCRVPVPGHRRRNLANAHLGTEEHTSEPQKLITDP